VGEGGVGTVWQNQRKEKSRLELSNNKQRTLRPTSSSPSYNIVELFKPKPPPRRAAILPIPYNHINQHATVAPSPRSALPPPLPLNPHLLNHDLNILPLLPPTNPQLPPQLRSRLLPLHPRLHLLRNHHHRQRHVRRPRRVLR
jgi:hypothetical protein